MFQLTLNVVANGFTANDDKIVQHTNLPPPRTLALCWETSQVLKFAVLENLNERSTAD